MHENYSTADLNARKVGDLCPQRNELSTDTAIFNPATNETILIFPALKVNPSKILISTRVEEGNFRKILDGSLRES
jgi:hypothetical protein